MILITENVLFESEVSTIAVSFGQDVNEISFFSKSILKYNIIHTVMHNYSFRSTVSFKLVS